MSRAKTIITFAMLTLGGWLVLRWPAGAQPAPAASSPLLVRMLPLARDLVTLDGTALAVPNLGTVALTTVPSNKYLVITEVSVSGLVSYTSSSGTTNRVTLQTSSWDLIDAVTSATILQGAVVTKPHNNPIFSANDIGAYASATGMAVAPAAALALRYTEDPYWTGSGYTTTADLHYHIVGYYADR